MILLPALVVAFAAFCVWLTVRIVNRRERWAKWTLAVVVGMPVLVIAAVGLLPGTGYDHGLPMTPEETKKVQQVLRKLREEMRQSADWPSGERP